MSNTHRLQQFTLLAAMAAGTTVGLGQGALVYNTGDSNVASKISDANLPGSVNISPWLDDDTIAENLDIFADRVQIAQLAVWNGPGPGDIAPILAGDLTWLDRMRDEAREYFADTGGFIPGVTVKPMKSTRSRRFRGAMVDAQDDFGAAGNQPDIFAHRVNRLWPTATVDGVFLAQIPYSFDDDMIAAWQARFDPDLGEEEQNAVAGIASSLATMLIIEQVAPVQFVGFNPQTDPANGFLQFTNAGDENFDPMTGRVPNVVSRLGRANTANDEEEPTTITHETWGNFPSIVRSLGFVLGLDWEQRHPDRDDFIIIQPQNIPPQTFPLPIPSVDGNDGPGVTTLTSPDPDLDDPTTAGPLLFNDLTLLTTAVETPGCSFDFDSIMLLRPFDLGLSASYIIRDEFRYIDLDGNNIIDTTPFGVDDRMASQPPSLFFSDCDIAALEEMYSVEFRWYYGLNPNCPHDVNNDGIQGGADLRAFIELWENRDPSADLVPPLGVIDLLDLQAFSLGDEDNNIDFFTPGFCNQFGPPGPGFRPEGNIFPPEG